MKFVDEFRDPELAKKLAESIKLSAAKLAKDRTRPIQLMEFCGGHTHTIFRYGIEQLLPDNVEMVHGPGCPVCVLPMGKVDDCVAIAERPEVIFTTFGDAMRVPGSKKSLLQAKADGADIRMVYSPMDALKLAQQNPDREVVFFALGFETTMPSTALTLLAAKNSGTNNFSLFCNHITTAPTIKAVLDDPDMKLDGFLAPGHVSMVIGEQPFQFIVDEYQKSIVITGFEPLDILQSIDMLLTQLVEGRREVGNQYKRVVRATGNEPGLKAMAEVFEPVEMFELRGLGLIGESGAKIRDSYAAFDAVKKFNITSAEVADPELCQCGEVLKGLIKPWQCKIFGTQCTPELPMGALMVSSEGACAAYYNYSNKPHSKSDEAKANA